MNRLLLIGIPLVIFGAVLFIAFRPAARAPRPSPHDEPPWFADVTDELGLDFVHDAGPEGTYFLPQVMGSGVALFDFDNDGRLDLYFLQNGGPRSSSRNRLFRQLPNGKFKDVSEDSGLDISGHNMGVAIGDVNNDGWPDVVVTQYSGVKLFLNQGNGTFRDVTSEAGLSNPAWGASAAFFDYDRDGWLDLIVVNYLDYDPSHACTAPNGTPDFCAPRVFAGTVSRLFHNEGRGARGQGSGKNEEKRTSVKQEKTDASHPSPLVPHFADVSLASGVGRLAGPGLGVICADFDGDGWPDVFVANDGQPNRLWINQRNGTFTEEAVVRGLAYNGMGQAQAGMGVALGDVDGDGLMDVFATHLSTESNTLWKQKPRGLYKDHTGSSRLGQPAWQGTGFGTVMADFDLDGALDLAVVNGHVAKRQKLEAPELGPYWGWYGDRNQLFANDGSGRFREISLHNPAFSSKMNLGRGLVSGDIDGDGAIDLVVTSIAGRARIFRNVTPRRGHWLGVRALLPSPDDPGNRQKDRDALGAEITVVADGRRLVRVLNGAESYLCSSQPQAHFGLGKSTRVDIEILWPDGSRQGLPDVAADQVITVRRDVQD
jgi:hypothetical protein